MHQSRGYTLHEYAMLFGLMGILAFAGLNVLGSSIFDLFGTVTEKSTGNGMNTYLNSVFSTQQPTGKSASVLNGTQTGSNIAVTGMGNSLLNKYSASSTNVTSVDGVGKVQQSTTTLTKLAMQLQADPNHDPQVLALVTQLANTGHSAASSLAVGLIPYQQSIQAGKGNQTLEDTEINQTVTDTINFNKTSQQLADYLKTNPQALSPEMMSAIQAASSDAMGILGSVVNVNGTTPGILGDQINQAGWQTLATQSLQVHTDSNTICQNGGDRNSCVQ